MGGGGGGGFGEVEVGGEGGVVAHGDFDVEAHCYFVVGGHDGLLGWRGEDKIKKWGKRRQGSGFLDGGRERVYYCG